MSQEQNRFWRYVRLGFVAAAFVIYPYLVNQLPELADFLQDVPTVWIVLAALAFGAIVVVVPDLLNEDPITPEELRQKFWAENQKIIEQRLKGSLDQGSHIRIKTEDSPQHLGRGQAATASTQTEETEPKSGKGRQGFWRFLMPWKIAPVAETVAEFLIPRPRELRDLKAKKTRQLEESKPISEIFEEANRRLLILGEPGSGKTTELLKLARALGKAAEIKAAEIKAGEDSSEKPIPVIFELSAWRGERMLDWMAEQMAARYGLNIQICREWLEHDKIVPLLDGLDELGRGKNGIKEAIGAIDYLQESYGEQLTAIAICCRIEDYENAAAEGAGENSADPAQGRNFFQKIDRAVRLRDLDKIQIENYLNQRKAAHIWDELQSRPGFMELARSPMLLNLMPIAYPHGLPQNTPQNTLQDREACQEQLFEEFLHRKLDPAKWDISRQLKDCDHKQARDYLAWLAASMEREEIKQREFLIEGLQPTWLENEEQRKQYRLIGGLIGGLIVGLIGGLIGGLIFGLIGGLIVGLIFGLIYDENDSIELTEALDLSGQGIKRGLASGLRYALIFGLILGLIVGLIVGLIGGLIGGLIVGLIVGLIGGLIGGLKAELKTRKYPNQGIWETRTKTLITIVLAAPLCPLIYIVPRWATGQEFNLVEALITGGLFGIFLGFMSGGGLALVQHFSLRWVLRRRGRMPWNYAAFLEEASRVGILRQSGGRFRFYHDKLREHLASNVDLNFEAKSSESVAEKYRKYAVQIVLGFAAILLAAIATSTTAFNPDSVAALTPVIQGSDRIWIDRIAYPRWRSPQRYHIILFSTSDLAVEFPPEFVTVSRRILALPGETVAISEGRIVIDNKPFPNSELKLPAEFVQAPITLGAEEYYVIGDNPDYPNPETFAAVVPRQNIRGQILLRLSPLSRFGFVD